MCVRTLVGNETSEPIAPTTDSKQSSKTSRAKEKYMRLYEEMLEKEELQRRRAKEEEDEEDTLYLSDLADDVLVASTNHYSLMLKKLSTYYEVVRRSKAFKILFYTTQPAHVITIAAVLFVTTVLFPIKGRVQVSSHPYSRMMSFIYLASFVIHFGAQIWMTFVSGLSLYFALPRHAFGEVQRVLFPRYFTINACLSLITLLIFVKHHPAHTWDAEIGVQVGAMSGAFFLELLIRLYLTPPLLQLIVQKNNFERAVGVGNEIGRHNPGPLKNCTHYLKIHRAFRRVHVCIAMGNMLTMACTVLHLYYIASKLCAL
ncbi:transmembrane protein 205 [Temnothorax curvispinosus]|uniref:Transmembrane protein 205 n=1 Tax=Temnothorax curvispinosus TaxID=300111 RepID=A0A6J1R153_9HYME|nr:transmembrane protein 205 [Temnothorax curvispinosus]